jgi:hypothetical protein
MSNNNCYAFRKIRCASLLISLLILKPESTIADEYSLKPLVGLEPPMDEGVTVTFKSPDDWEPWAKMNEARNDFPKGHNDFVRVFTLLGHANEEHPEIQLSVQAWIPGRWVSAKLSTQPSKPIDLRDPWGSMVVLDMESAGVIKKLRKVGSFDAGENGKLPIWQIRSEAYDCLLVLVGHQHTSVNICLRADDADSLQKYIPDLEKLARTVRFVARKP